MLQSDIKTICVTNFELNRSIRLRDREPTRNTNINKDKRIRIIRKLLILLLSTFFLRVFGKLSFSNEPPLKPLILLPYKPTI